MGILAFAILLRFLITCFVTAAGDSYAHLSTARYIAQTWTIPLFEPIYRPFFYYPPAFHVATSVMYTLFSAFGERVATKAMDFVAPILGSLMLVVFYRFCRDNLSKRITLYAVIFLAFIPLHVYYSTLMHVDIAIAFVGMLVLHLYQKGRFYRSAICNGIGMLTKYTHFFIFPPLLVLMVQRHKGKKGLVKKAAVYFAITLVIGLPLYIRNFIVFGTPMWPFMNGVFERLGMVPFPYTSDDFPKASLAHFLDPEFPLKIYLDIFGVPLGLPENLFSLPVPVYFFVGWFVMTGLFSIPFIVGLWAKKPRKSVPLLAVWILSYTIMLAYYVYDYGDVYMRLVLPMFPAVAIIWAHGLDWIHARMRGRYQTGLMVVLIVFCLVFAGLEIVKARVASAKYDRLSEDYRWIRENIPQDARFDRHSTYLLYHTNKQVISTLCGAGSYPDDSLYHYSDPFVEPGGPQEKYRDWTVVYTNPKTQVKVLKKTPVV